MIQQILKLLNTLCSGVATLLHARRKAQEEARKDAISSAVHSGDAEAVERITRRLLKLALLFLLPLTLFGCAPQERVVVVNQPMVPVRLVHEGSPGWWLSDALFEATLLKLETLKTQTEKDN